MRKQEFWRFVSIVMVLVTVFLNWGNGAIAEEHEETAGSVSNLSDTAIEYPDGFFSIVRYDTDLALTWSDS
ncbi:MAG: hypothetical protein IJ043_04200 [Clostridia bacterium]|nr:hypothetical protein [Clostridia bacterium]